MGANKSKELWAGLEDYILQHAATYEQRLAVFTGPILLPEDPTYRGAQIPLRFYKIAAWLGEQRLTAPSYVLDRTPLVRRILDAPDRQAHTAPSLGAYKTFQVTITDITRLTNLTMPDLTFPAREPSSQDPGVCTTGLPKVDQISYARRRRPPVSLPPTSMVYRLRFR